MTPITLIKRLIKGTPLTALEHDNNITNLKTASEELDSLKANIASPTFTGTVGGVTKAMVGLSNVDNTTDLLKPISTATQAAISLQTEAIANLATAQASITNEGTLALTAVNQTLPFAVTVNSTDTAVFTLDPIAETITFLKNASYNFLSNVTFLSGTSSPRTITFDLVNAAGGGVLVSEVVALSTPSGGTETASMNTLITVGRNGIPSAPLTMQVKARANDTGYTIQEFSSILASSSSYDISAEASGITYDNTTSLLTATNVQTAVDEVEGRLDNTYSKAITPTVDNLVLFGTGNVLVDSGVSTNGALLTGEAI